jgi:hypothetical protein
MAATLHASMVGAAGQSVSAQTLPLVRVGGAEKSHLSLDSKYQLGP